MTPPRILVAGIGNIFLGDDAFGVEVVQRLAKRTLPEGVRVIDFGIRGFDLAFALQDDYDAAILVDAIRRDGPPGTLYVIQPDLETVNAPDDGGTTAEAHGMNPDEVFRLVKAMGGRFPRIRLVGCEPATLGPEGGGDMGLSPLVLAAVGPATELVESLVGELRTGNDEF